MSMAMSMDYKRRIESAATACAAALRKHRLKVAVAESCTGGWVGKALSDAAGASEWFAGGFIVYDNAAKRALLGVDASVLDKHGAVSEQTTAAMCAGALEKIAHADISVSVSGNAGPTGEPRGRVCFGVQGRGETAYTECVQLDGERDAVREQATEHALNLCRKHLQS